MTVSVQLRAKGRVHARRFSPHAGTTGQAWPLSKIMDLLPGMNALKASEIIQLVKQFDGMADVMRHMRRPRLDPD
jgi:hypothetical protein